MNNILKMTLSWKTLPPLILLLSLQSASAGDFEEGAKAASHNDSITAFKLWQPLAENGETKVQYNLGVMYHIWTGHCPRL